MSQRFRIVGGELRGRKLDLARGALIRPTRDAVKESVFNILEHHHKAQLQARVLDLYAGTGQLGLEALSRGAQSVTFVEQSRELVNHLKQFGKKANVLERMNFVHGKLPAVLSRLEDGEPYDLVLADPPYAYDPVEVLGVILQRVPLATEHLLVLETSFPAPELGDDIEIEDQRRYGTTAITFLRRKVSP